MERKKILKSKVINNLNNMGKIIGREAIPIRALKIIILLKEKYNTLTLANMTA